MLRYLDAGESHSIGFTAIIEGLPSNLSISQDLINIELSKRQMGYGRGTRMQIEKDTVEIISGVRFGKTIASPIAIMIKNKDWQNWQDKMSIEEHQNIDETKVSIFRPGHADFAGLIKYCQKDIRNILERASARQTAIRTAIGAITKQFLAEFNIFISSEILEIGGKDPTEIKNTIDIAKQKGDTVGGIFAIKVTNVPIGLGSHVYYDKKIDANLSFALMSLQAIKGVEIGQGFLSAKLFGSEVHDAIYYDQEAKKVYRKTNNAGGIEGGMTNGEDIIIKLAMKPIPTMINALASFDFEAKQETKAHIERSDVCAIEAASVVAENIVAFEIAKFFLEKFAGDSMQEVKKNFANYQEYIKNFFN